MQSTKKTDFSNHNFYIGLDVHKKSWQVTILTDGLEQLPLNHPSARCILDELIDQFKYLHTKKLFIETQLRKKIREKDAPLFKLLTSIPGIEPITAIGIMAEIGDINRFTSIKHFASYLGLIPRISQSGEKENIGDITYRHNSYLRPLIVEASWQAIRSDPVMPEYYKHACGKTISKKAIIKVARKLLSKIMFIMKHREPYLKNMK